MRRFLRLLTLWLLALAFPIQGATAATAMPTASPHAAQHAMHHDMSAMPRRIVSPGLRKRWRPMPTPAGVPVAIRSPGSSVM